MRRKAKLAEIDDPFVSSTPRRAPSKGADAGGQVRRVPSLNAPPLSKDMPSSPFETSAPASMPAPTEQPARARLRRDYSHIKDETVPLEDISSAAAARESAARASMPVQAAGAPIDMLNRVDSVPVPPRQAPAALAEPLAAVKAAKATSLPASDLPMVGFSDAPPADQAPAAPIAAPAPAPAPAPGARAPARAAVKTLPPPAVKTAPPPAIAAAPVPAPSAAGPVKSPEPIEEREARGTGTMPKPAAPAAEGPKILAEAAVEAAQDSAEAASPAQLGDVVLSGIADELRKFPEVEWACQLAAPDEHVIGIRVDPSYLTRTKDIEAKVVAAAKKAGALIQPLIVSTPAATKDARARGRMFFPWKKKQ